MKKLIVIFLTLVLLFSIFVMSSCEQNTADTPTSGETTSSSNEETSSETKATRRLNPDENSNSTGSNGGGGGYTPVSAQPSTSAPSGLIGESFYPKQVNVPENASIDLKMLIQMITYLEITPSNFREQESLLLDAELLYGQIPDKSQVINYDDLVKAREVFTKLTAASFLSEFEQILTNLPALADLRNANVDSVYKAKKLYDGYKSYFSENLTNFAELETKLNASYEKVVSSIVEKSFIAQDLDGDGVIEPEAQLNGKTYSELAGAKKRVTGSDFFDLYVEEPGKISISGSAGTGVTYSDKLNANISLFQYFNFETITFNCPCAGTLTFYVRKDGNKTYVVTQDDETIDTFSSIKDASQPDANVTRVVEIKNASKVVLTTDNPTNKGYVYAIKFSYPNLG